MHATVRFLAWGAIPVGAVLGGWLGGAVGLRQTMWAAAAGGLVSVLAIALSPVRRLRPVADAMPAEGLAATGQASEGRPR